MLFGEDSLLVGYFYVYNNLLQETPLQVVDLIFNKDIIKYLFTLPNVHAYTWSNRWNSSKTKRNKRKI